MLGLPVWAGVAVLVVAIGATDLLLWRLVIMPRVRGRVADAAGEATIALGGEVIMAGTARFLGLESDGRRQVRGTGHLAVGRDEVSSCSRRHSPPRTADRTRVAFDVGRSRSSWEEAPRTG